MSVQLNNFLSFFVVGFFIPFLVDLVTKRVAEPKFKALALLALSLVGSGVTDYFANPQVFSLQTYSLGFAVTFLSAVSTLFGFAKPVGLSGKDGIIAAKVPSGLGKSGVQVLTTETISTVNLNQLSVAENVKGD